MLNTEYSRTVNLSADIMKKNDKNYSIFENMDTCMSNNVHIKFNKLIMEIPFFLSCIFGNHLFEKDQLNDNNMICVNTKLILEKVYLDNTHNVYNFKEKLIDHIIDNYLPELNNGRIKELIVDYDAEKKDVDINKHHTYNQKDFYAFDKKMVIEYNKQLKSTLSSFKTYESSQQNKLSNMQEIKYTYPDNEFLLSYHLSDDFNIINKDKLTSYVYPTITKLLQDLSLVYDQSLDDEFMTITYFTKGWFQFYIRKLEDVAKINTAALLYHTILKKTLNQMTSNNNIFDVQSSNNLNRKYFRIFSQFSVFFKELQSTLVETVCNKLFFYVKENTFNEDRIPEQYKTNDKIKPNIRYFNMDDEKLRYLEQDFFSQEYKDKLLQISKDKGAFFTNEVRPEILSGLLSISNIIKNDESCVLFSFGYSGVGKTTNIFGNSDSSLMNMIIKNIKDTHDIAVSISDFYGIKLNNEEPNVSVKSFNIDGKNIDDISFDENTQVFISLSNENAMVELNTLIVGIDTIRKAKGHIVKTSNNPNSSRSFIVYKFRFTHKQSSKENFLYVFDMPGVENPSLDSENDIGSTPSTSHFNMFFQNSGRVLEPIENIITTLYCETGDGETGDGKLSIPQIVEPQKDKTFKEESITKTTEQYNHTEPKKNHLTSKLTKIDIVNNLLNIVFSLSDSTTMYSLEAYNIKINYNDINNKISLLFDNISEHEHDQHIINYIVYCFNKVVQVKNFNDINVNDHGIKTYLMRENISNYQNLKPLWKFSRYESIQQNPFSTITSKKILKLNESLQNKIDINDKYLQEYYNTCSLFDDKANINKIIKKKLFLKGLKNYDYSEVYGGDVLESLETTIPFINEKGKQYFKQYLEGEFINHTLDVLSNDIYYEISSICYKKERTNDGELLNYIKKVIEQTSYVVNFFVVSNYNTNENLIAALEKNAQTNTNGTNPVNYRKYIYDTQFNILDTFKRYFD